MTMYYYPKGQYETAGEAADRSIRVLQQVILDTQKERSLWKRRALGSDKSWGSQRRVDIMELRKKIIVLEDQLQHYRCEVSRLVKVITALRDESKDNS